MTLARMLGEKLTTDRTRNLHMVPPAFSRPDILVTVTGIPEIPGAVGLMVSCRLFEALNRPDFAVPLIRTNVLLGAAKALRNFFHSGLRAGDCSEFVGGGLHNHVVFGLKRNGRRLNRRFANGAAGG